LCKYFLKQIGVHKHFILPKLALMRVRKMIANHRWKGRSEMSPVSSEWVMGEPEV
jgi:hypothetical protein